MPLKVPIALLVFCMAFGLVWGKPHLQNTDTTETAEAMAWHIPEHSDAFSRLWCLMDSIQAQEPAALSVLYIGGSHVQAGWLGHTLRRNLHEWAPHLERSRGMYLPYRIANTNTPTHFRTEYEGNWNAHRCTRGAEKDRCTHAPLATGILVEPSGPTRIQHVAYYPDSTRASTRSLEIWTDAPPSMWQWDGNTPLQRIEPLPDSTGWLLHLNASADTLALQLDIPKGTTVWYAGMHPVTNNPSSLTVNEWGHNGCRINHVAEAKGWEALIERLDPDLVFIGIGLNDAVQGPHLNMDAFASHYTPWIQRIRSSGTAVVLLGNTSGSYKGRSLAAPNARIEAFFESCGESLGVGYMNLTNAMNAKGNAQTWEANGWLKTDGLHYTKEGYTQIAELIFQAWMASYSASKNNASLNPQASDE